MNIPPIKQGTAVAIEWDDSKAEMGWVYNPIRQRVPGEIRSLGYCVQKNDRCITITTSLDKRGASLDELAIPAGCITSIEVLPSDWSFGGPEENENGR